MAWVLGLCYTVSGNCCIFGNYAEIGSLEAEIYALTALRASCPRIMCHPEGCPT